MRKILLALAAALAFAGAACAESTLRFNYRTKGITHISADYEFITPEGADPFWTRVEFVGFPDGSSAYLLYLNFESKKATTVPKGVKMAATLSNGKILRFEQIGSDSATKNAIRRGKNTVYWNRTKYLVEGADMEKMSHGVKSVDVITGWDPDDFMTAVFRNDELAKVISSQMKVIKEAENGTVELKDDLARYSDNTGSITAISNPVVAKGVTDIYNVSMTYLFYKDSYKEDFDLRIQIGTEKKHSIPVESKVVFTLADGSSVELTQTRDAVNFLSLYPALDDVRKLKKGVRTISYETEKGLVSDTFKDDSFSIAVNRLYQALMNVSAL